MAATTGHRCMCKSWEHASDTASVSCFPHRFMELFGTSLPTIMSTSVEDPVPPTVIAFLVNLVENGWVALVAGWF